MAVQPTSVTEVSDGLRGVGYLPGESTALVSYLATKLGKPVLVEGLAGVGKTELAKALSRYLDRSLGEHADYAVTIAKLTKLVADVEPDPPLQQSLQEMGERAEEMIRVALDSFADRDLDRAETLVELDELIDRTNRRFVERVVELVAEPELREWVLRMVLVSRTLERIGDHAVDIGEQVAYLLTAEFREFTDASHPEEHV